MKEKIKERITSLNNTITLLQQEIGKLRKQEKRILQGINEAEAAIISRKGAISELTLLVEENKK